MGKLDKLRDQRVKKGYNQVVVAKMIRISRASYSNKENGYTQFTIREAEALGIYLKVRLRRCF